MQLVETLDILTARVVLVNELLEALHEVARLRAHGAELLGEVAQYESILRLCYLHGPAGIIVALAEQIDWSAGTMEMPSSPATCSSGAGSSSV